MKVRLFGNTYRVKENAELIYTVLGAVLTMIAMYFVYCVGFAFL